MAVSWKKLKERASQVTGFQIPIIGAGVSWQPKEADVTKAHKLFVFLEDKRVLFYEEEWEFMPHAIQSVMHIREYLVERILMETDQDSPLYKSSKELRDACIEFLDLTQKLERTANGMLDWKQSNYRLMRIVLGQLRRRFGKELLNLSVLFEINVEDNLATIIPVSPNHDASLLSEDGHGQ